MTANLPTVFIVDDDPTLCDAMALLMTQVGLNARCFTSGQDFLDAYTDDLPGCLVVDVRMPGMSGLDLQRSLIERNIQIPVIIVSGHGDVPMAVRAMKLGAVDFIEKPFNEQELLDHIQACIENDIHAKRDRERRVLLLQRFEQLSKREREVMDMIIAGKYSKVIAAHLGISPKTVDVHRAHILEKMGVRSVAELVRIAIHLGIDQSEIPVGSEFEEQNARQS